MSMDVEKLANKNDNVPYFLDYLFPNISESHYDEIISYFYSLKGVTHDHLNIGDENKDIIRKGFLGNAADDIVKSLNGIINNFHAFHKNIDHIIDELELSKEDVRALKCYLNSVQEDVYDISQKFWAENGIMSSSETLARKWNDSKNLMIEARKNFDKNMLEHNTKIITLSTKYDYADIAEDENFEL